MPKSHEPERANLPRRPIYLDHHATTPLDQRVLEAMLPYFTDIIGNAASIDHEHGAEAHRAVEKARGQVAALLNAQADEIIWVWLPFHDGQLLKNKEIGEMSDHKAAPSCLDMNLQYPYLDLKEARRNDILRHDSGPDKG